MKRPLDRTHFLCVGLALGLSLALGLALAWWGNPLLAPTADAAQATTDQPPTAGSAVSAPQAGPNGFDLSKSIVPRGSILHGGPRRDGIRAIDAPTFVAASAAESLADDAKIVGVANGILAKAYPLSILTRYEIVNDTVGEKAIAVTYCPLTGSAIGFERPANDTFGVSGLVHESNLLLYDRATGSLFSQLGNRGLSGARSGSLLTKVPVARTTWGAWKRDHPNTVVLADPSPRPANSRHNPYADYQKSGALWFPISHRDGRLSPKALVLGIEVDGHAKAWSLEALAQTKFPHHARVGDTELSILGTNGRAVLSDGTPVATTISYWFAWATFHHATQLWMGDDQSEKQRAGGRAGADQTSDLALENISSSWDDLSALFMGGGEATPFAESAVYVISGTLRNTGKTAIAHAVLRYELLNESGTPIYTEEGYNRAAENLLDGRENAGAITPIAAGASDQFRMVFFGGEIPRFVAHRVTVAEAHPLAATP